MIPTKQYIEQKFKEFNSLMFGGRLPAIPVEMSDAKTFLGKFVYKTRKGRKNRILQLQVAHQHSRRLA